MLTDFSAILEKSETKKRQDFGLFSENTQSDEKPRC